MLGNSKVTVTMPVINLKRAASFYEKMLGLRPESSSERGQINYLCGGGTRIHLYERKEPTKADHTEATFEVTNIESLVRELRGKGVQFEEYNTPEIKTSNGIATISNEKAAWFKDTEGNILCLHEVIYQ